MNTPSNESTNSHQLRCFGRSLSDYAGSDCDTLTNEKLRRLLNTVRQPDPSVPQYEALVTKRIRRPTPGTVGKLAQDDDRTTATPSEALTLDIVFQSTTIPVPRVRRIIQHDRVTNIVMDNIPGRQLSLVWPTMPTWQKLRVVFTLRDYVRQLRAIRHPRSIVPGPVAPLGHPARVCYSPLFGGARLDRGPFASKDELSSFYNKRYLMSIRTDEPGIDKAGARARVRADPFDNSGPLVLTHQDITMRNIIVGDDGRLWLIDWAWAGFYPPWFEYVAMTVQSRHEFHESDPLWNLLIPFICRPYYRQEAWYGRTAIGLYLYK